MFDQLPTSADHFVALVIVGGTVLSIGLKKWAEIMERRRKAAQEYEQIKRKAALKQQVERDLAPNPTPVSDRR